MAGPVHYGRSDTFRQVRCTVAGPVHCGRPVPSAARPVPRSRLSGPGHVACSIHRASVQRCRASGTPWGGMYPVVGPEAPVTPAWPLIPYVAPNICSLQLNYIFFFSGNIWLPSVGGLTPSPLSSHTKAKPKRSGSGA